MLVTVTELKTREVIRVCDGKSMGCVSDIRIDSCTGAVLAICVMADASGLFSFGCEELVIGWDKIQCIGDDVILVCIKPEECICRPRPKRKKGCKECK